MEWLISSGLLVLIIVFVLWSWKIERNKDKKYEQLFKKHGKHDSRIM